MKAMKNKLLAILTVIYVFLLIVKTAAQEAEPLSQTQPGPVADKGQFTEPWERWTRNPISSPVLIQSETYGTQPVTLQLAGQSYTLQGTSCTVAGDMQIMSPSLHPYTQYALSLSGVDWKQVTLQFKGYISKQTLKKAGANSIAMPYLVYLNGEFIGTNLVSIATASCANWSTNLILEVRPDKGVRPSYQSAYEEQWSHDEDQNGDLAPGNGQWLELGPGRSTQPSKTAFRWSVDLGKMWNGLSAGKIRIIEESISSNVFNSKALVYVSRSDNTNEIDVVTNALGGLRQIRAPQVLVDIQATNSPSEFCNLKFYIPANAGAKTNGLYPVLNSPFVTWRLLNPGTSGNYTQLNIVEDRPGRSYTNLLSFDGTNLWKLVSGYGGDYREETRQIQTNTLGRKETVLIKSSTNTLYKAIEDYQQFLWGWEITNVVTNPDGSGLTNSFAYHANTNEMVSFGKLFKHISPGGRWEVFCYPYWDTNLVAMAQGWPLSDAFTDSYAWNEVRIRGWKDLSLLPAPGLTNVVLTRIDRPSTGVDIHDPHREEVYYFPVSDGSIDPVLLSNEWVANGDYSTDGNTLPNEYRGKTIAQGFAVDGFTLNYSQRYRDAGAWYNDLVRQYQGENNSADLYEYQRGAFSSGTWTNNDNGHDLLVRKTSGFHYTGILLSSLYASYWQSIYWTPDPLPMDCVLNKSTQDTSYLQNGNPVEIRTSGMSAIGSDPSYGNVPVFTLMQKTRNTYDSLGHLTNSVWVDVNSANVRTTYEADYRDGSGNDTELKAWEKDEVGRKWTFAYDSRKRMTNTTLVGVAVSGTYASVADLSTNYVFNSVGWPLSITVSSGSQSLAESRTYDLSGRLTQIQQFDGTTSALTYAANTLSTSETLSGGLTKITARYLDGRLKSITGSKLVPEFYDYFVQTDPAYLYYVGAGIARVYFGTNNSPRWREEGKNSAGMVVSTRQPSFGTNTVVNETRAYDLNGFLTSVTKPTTAELHLEVDYSYDFYGGMEPYSHTYEINGENLLSSSDPRAQCAATFFIHDGTNWWREIDEWSALGSQRRTNITRQRLSGFSSSTTLSEGTITDTKGNVSTFSLVVDRTQAKVTATTNTPQSTIDILAVSRNGLVQSMRSESVSNPTWHYYDGLQREIAQVDPLGFVSGVLYNANGWPVAQTNAAGLVTATDYYGVTEKNAGKPKAITRPDSKTTYVSYNDRGQMVQTWGDVPYPEERVYDSTYGDMTELHTFRGSAAWSASTWPSSPPSFDKTTFTYDAATGLLTSKKDAANKSTTFVYDSAHALKLKILARATGTNLVTITNTWSGFGQILQKDYSDGTPSSVVYGYTSLGMPWKSANGSLATTYYYGDDGDLLGTYHTAGVLEGLAVTNGISPLYGPSSVAVLNLDGTPAYFASYGYDTTAGRLKSVTNGLFTATYAYLANSDLLNTTTFASNGTTRVTSTRQWDFGYRLRGINHAVGGVGVAGHNYGYDLAERRTRAWLEDGSYWAYGYDDRDEVTSGKRYWVDHSPVPGEQYQYAYDGLGNRTNSAAGGDSSGQNLRSTGYTVNNLNQYTTVTNSGYVEIVGSASGPASVTVNTLAAYERGEFFHKELAGNTTTNPIALAVSAIANISGTTATNSTSLLLPPQNQALTNDLDGNLTSDRLWVYVWDAENRLTSMYSPTNVPTASRRLLEFGYDYEGKRISKKVSTWVSGNWSQQSHTVFLYDGWRPLVEMDGTTVANLVPTLLRTYTWGQDLSGSFDNAGGIGGLVAYQEIQGANTWSHFPIYDGNGNVTGLYSGAGERTAKYEYSPFGELITKFEASTVRNPLRFSTKYQDSETSLVYYGYRYYSAPLGRWINRDPIEEDGGLNLFAFTGNNGIHRFDALGKESVADVEATEAISGGMDGEAGMTLSKIYNNAKEFKENVSDYADMWNLAMDCVEGDPSDLLIKISNARKDIAGMSKGDDHGHHMVPQRMRGLMEGLNINIDQDKFKKGLSKIIHKKLHGGNGFDNKFGSDAMGRKGGMWNFMWRKFMGKNAKADEKAIEAFVGRMAGFFGI